MKKIFLFAAICAAALVTSCQTKNLEVSESPEMKTMTVTCAIADVSTKLGISDQGKVTWEAGDQILFHGKWIGGAYSYTATLEAGNISADGKTATVTIEEFTKGSPSGDQASNLYALYPASAVMADSGASNWRSVHPFTDSNKPLMAGYNKETDGTVFTFINLCGLISFSVSGEFDNYEFAGNNDEVVAYDGYQAEVYWSTAGEQVTNLTKGGSPLTKVKGTLEADGSTVHYICIPNGVNFTGGFNFKFKDGNDIVKVATSNTAVNIPRSGLLKLGNISSKLTDYVAPTTDSHKSSITGATDLSANGAANCYVITAPGKYKIPVVKGNDKEQSAGEVFGVELVWETYNNTEEVTPNSVIAAVDYDGPENYVYFQTPETLKPGNALIAAKNSSGTIIWSWHIWIPSTEITLVDYTADVKMMNRNLGALVDAKSGEAATAESCGLLYQWGRKDPFIGLGEMKEKSSTAATTSKAFAEKSLVPITIAASIANPTQFAYNAETAVDPDYAGKNWSSDDNNNAWNNNGKKGLYDPCPAGYKVPVYDEAITFWTADWTLNLEQFFYSQGSIVCPYAGYLDDCGGSLSHGGDRSAIWSATAGSETRATSIDVRSSVSVPKSQYKARGNSVRCVAE